MKNTAKTISLILCLMIIVLSFSACTYRVTVLLKFDDYTTADSSLPVSQTQSASQTQAQETYSATAQTDVTAPLTEAAALPEQTAAQTSANEPQVTQPATTAAPADNSTGMSKEKIVEIYNESVNKVKREATTLTRNYKKLSSLDEYLEMPSAIQGIAKSAMNTFVKGSDTPESWTSKDDMKIVFPVGNEDYSSHLTSSMVKSATCTESANTYEIDIVLSDDAITSPKKGAGYAGIFNTVTADTITGVSIPGVNFESVNVNGINGEIKCTVDKASKRVTNIIFMNTDILDINVKVVVSNLHVKMALASEESFSVKY